ncbi:MAG: hypothetical protein PQJ46_15125 [Spirochaetales bacterium]|nr:hypothetical protein [Spirochaetales bacterium]
MQPKFTNFEKIVIANFYAIIIMLLGFGIMAAALLLLFSKISFVLKLISEIFLVFTDIFIFFKAQIIFSRRKIKERIINILCRRIEKNGYKQDLFSNSVGDPCLRLITFSILKKIGKSSEFREIVRTYKNNKIYYIEKTGSVIETLIEEGEIAEEDLIGI